MKNLSQYNEELSVPRKKDVDARQAKINVVGPLQGNGNGDVSVAETTPTGTIMIPAGILKGTENGGIEAATPGTDYITEIPVTSVNGKTGEVKLVKADVGLSQVANVTQYSAKNPPPYPVTSVNGKTGDVTVREVPSVTASDNGKFLRVVNGAWAAVSISDAHGGSF